MTAGALRYITPAERWFDGLPLGNGRIGAMWLAAPRADRITLTESTVWSGRPSSDDINPGAAEHLPIVRDLLWRGEKAAAQALAAEQLTGRPSAFGTHLPLPELRVEYALRPGEPDFERSLDLDRGVAHAVTSSRGADVRRAAFVSNPARVLVHEVHADAPTGLDVSFGPAVVPATLTVEGAELVLTGAAHEILHSDGASGTRFQVRVRVETDGRVERVMNLLRVHDATTVTLLVAIGTDWSVDGQRPDPEAEARATLAAATAEVESLRAGHEADHASLMGRVALDLGPSQPEVAAQPTDVRRSWIATGSADPELQAQFFQYGRYLTIAGSRADSPLPLALQGLWNDSLASSTSWTNDFHLDMNTQQNYWAAEVGALPETHEPLMAFVERLATAGEDTARRMYGSPGWVAHTVTNAWGYSAPGRGAGWGMFICGGAWIALHLWDHFEFSGDLQFLRDRAYPVVRGAAEFLLDQLVEDPETGWLVTGPSESPENWYLAEDGSHAAVSMGPTVDRVFTEAMLRIAVEAAELIGLPAGEFERRAAAARERLAPLRVGANGQVMEWLRDEGEAEPSHRHTSHLCALYPERQITRRGTPELAKASERTLELREAAPGWEQTEWVEANMMVYHARLGNGDEAERHLRALMSDATEANLMTYSVGGVAGAAQNIYSFDGNPGGTAGVAELLVQSERGELDLLPALPTAWPTGSVSGLRARGGLSVDVAWSSGRLTTATITSSSDQTVTVLLGEESVDLRLVAGRPATLLREDFASA